MPGPSRSPSSFATPPTKSAENISEWLDDLKDEHADADRKIAAARQAVVDAEVEKAKLTQMEMWLVKHRGGRR